MITNVPPLPDSELRCLQHRDPVAGSGRYLVEGIATVRPDPLACGEQECVDHGVVEPACRRAPTRNFVKRFLYLVEPGGNRRIVRCFAPWRGGKYRSTVLVAGQVERTVAVEDPRHALCHTIVNDLEFEPSDRFVVADDLEYLGGRLVSDEQVSGGFHPARRRYWGTVFQGREDNPRRAERIPARRFQGSVNARRMILKANGASNTTMAMRQR